MITVGSDFSGVGAFDQALMRLGIDYKTIFTCDMDKYARLTYITNYGEPKYYPENVYDREIPKQPLDIYMTSPPCQAFSLAGKRKGEDDKRGILFYNSHEFIKVNKPRYFIFENVKGLLSDNNGKTFGKWQEYLGGKSINGNTMMFPHPESVPYHIYWKVLNAKDYGVPQNRERVFIIGIRDDEDNVFNWPKPFKLKKRLKDVLENQVDEKYFLSEKRISQLVENTEHLCVEKNKVSNTLRCGGGGSVTKKHSFDVIKVFGNTNPSGNGMNGNVFEDDGISPTLSTNKEEGIKVKTATNKGYEEATEGDSINFSQTLETSCNQGVMIGAFGGRNPGNTSDRTPGAPTEQRLELNHNGTSNTITSVQKDNVVLEGYKIRRLTPRECFRLMDFLDSFKMPCSDTQMYKQAGNSIVVNVLAKIIENLKIQ